MKEAARDRIDAEKDNHLQTKKNMEALDTEIHGFEIRVKRIEDKLKM